jgi:HD-like signal output (HDOD) protein
VPLFTVMILTTSLSRQNILAKAAQLPAAPQIMARLYTLLLDVNSGLDSIATLLRRDAGLTSRIIRIANSAALGGAGIGNIEDALQRIGFGEVYRLVGAAANSTLPDRPLRCYGYTSERFRAHNLLSALVAERLAQRTDLDPRGAYTAGLLRRIGQLLLDILGRESLAPSEMFPQSGGTRVAIWEKATFGLDHYAVGGILLLSWGFPEEIVNAVEHGHGTGGSLSPLGAIIEITDNIVRFAGHGLDGEETEWGLPQEKLQAIGITFEEVNDIKTTALEQLKAFQAAL